MTDEQRKEFEAVAMPLVDWINKNGHPHMCAIVDQTGAELLEGVVSFYTEKYLRD